MFRFKFVLDYFQFPQAKGPILAANMRAKWLTRLRPEDLEIAFAPYRGQVPLYDADKIKIIKREEPGWWNHYFFNSWLMQQETNNQWSLGPNIDPTKPIRQQIPLVVNSLYQKNKLLQEWDYPSELLFVIPNMIDPELFYPGEKAKKATVGWIGYDHPSKYTKGVEVIPNLARKFPDIQFEMIHGIKPKYQHEWLPENLPNLKIHVQVPHIKIPEIIRKWHVLVCGSKWETGATHIKEAMASGVPIIAAEVGAIPEVASRQLLLSGMKWEMPPKVTYPYSWTTESLERFAQALETILSDPIIYEAYFQAALEESKQAHPQIIAQKWFEFIYQCRDFNS